ncbi:protein MpGH3B [Marchantia polymorpha subsp. ruderalis]
MHCKALHLSSSQYALLLAHCQTPVNKTMEERMGRGVPLFVEPERPEEVVERIVYLLENVKDIQRSLLENLLKKHGDCEYLEKYKKDGKIDVQTFRERVPLITYEDIQRDIQRTAQRGKHANILCCEEPVHFHQSGGTSGGKLKMLPVTGSARETLVEYFVMIDAWFHMKSTVKRTSAGGIGMTFFFGGDCLKTPGGHDLLLVSSWFVRQSMSAYRQTPERFASPLEVILCRDFAQSVYCQLLCGLIRSAEVAMMSSLIISVLATAVTFLQENWEELCNDISTGKLSARITDQKVRRAVSQILHTPDPELAAKIRAECSKDTWAGILTRLWPNLRFI